MEPRNFFTKSHANPNPNVFSFVFTTVSVNISIYLWDSGLSEAIPRKGEALQWRPDQRGEPRNFFHPLGGFRFCGAGDFASAKFFPCFDSEFHNAFFIGNRHILRRQNTARGVSPLQRKPAQRGKPKKEKNKVDSLTKRRKHFADAKSAAPKDKKLDFWERGEIL